MPGLQGLSRYGAGNTFGQESKQELLKEEGGSPINVMSTITPESLTKMMKRMGQGVGPGANVATQAAAGADPSKGLGASPSGGFEKKGHTGEETSKFLGFNAAGVQTLGDSGWNTVLSGGLNKGIAQTARWLGVGDDDGKKFF